jgi:L-lactate utilization protein LutC
LEALDLVSAFDAKGIPLYLVDSFSAGNGDEKREAIRRNIMDSYIGITPADFAMADTGALVMRTRPGQPESTCSQALICPESVRAFFAAVAKDIVPPQKHFV